MSKAYLGDGVYVTRDERGFVLTTENGVRSTNTIVLEDAVVEALIRYVLTPDAYDALASYSARKKFAAEKFT